MNPYKLVVIESKRQNKDAVAWVLASYEAGGIFAQLNEGTGSQVHRSIVYDFILGMQPNYSKNEILATLAKQHFLLGNHSQWRQWINSNFAWLGEDGKEISFSTRFGETGGNLPVPSMDVI